MKGLNIQFDNLVEVLQKNIKNKELLQNRDSFDLVYEKITQETLKITSLIVDMLVEDFSIKQSYTKLQKQLKAFLALKPMNNEEDEDDFFNKQFDELRQFMNSRKPVLNQIDNSERGDIYKFLFHAQNKQKDTEEFMNNMAKFNTKGSKKFLATNQKWKATMKSITAIKQQAQVQTDLSMSLFSKIQSKFATLFKVQSPKTIDPLSNQSSDKGSKTQQLDFEAQIDKIVQQRLQEKMAMSQQQKKELEAENKKEDKTKSQSKKSEENNQQGKKKKLNPNSNKRTSQITPRKQSIQNLSSQIKSGFKNRKEALTNVQRQQSNSNFKSTVLSIIQEKNADTSTATNLSNFSSLPNTNVGLNDKKAKEKIDGTNANNFTGLKQSQNVQKDIKIVPDFGEVFQQLSKTQSLKQLTNDQLRIIYDTMKNSFARNMMEIQSQKPEMLTKEVNTDLLCSNELNAFRDQNSNNSPYSNTNSKLNSQNPVNSKDSSSLFDKKVSDQLSCNWVQNMTENNNLKNESKIILSSNEHSLKQTDSKNVKNVKFDSQLGKQDREKQLQKLQKQSKIRSNSKNNQQHLPQISKSKQTTQEQNQQVDRFARQGRSAQEYLKKTRQTKYGNSQHRNQNKNKENYSLDMYKAKKDLVHKNRASEHVNLPSLTRNNQNQRVLVSLHEQVAKTPYLKKSSKKNLLEEISASSPYLMRNLSDASQVYPQKFKKEKNIDVFKEEQRIMRELERISNENSIKTNLKSISMYVQFVESVHLRRCGQKCIHLERFYDFLRKNNFPNRKELILHKADMNVNVKL